MSEPGSPRRVWIVGAVAVMAAGVVAISVVWALDASSRAAVPGSKDHGLVAEESAHRATASAPLAETAAPAPSVAEPVAPEPVAPEVAPARKPEPEPETEPEPPAALENDEPPPAAEHRPAIERTAPPRSPKVGKTARSSPPTAVSHKKPEPEPEATSAPAEPTASPAQLYKEGAQLTLAGKLAEAQKKYVAALRVSPGYAPALRGLGLVYEKSGQKTKAIKSLQAYLRLAPKAADAAAIRARIERLRN